jgi:phage tail-like protein
MPVDRKDPLLANRFKIALEINGITEAGFAECTGIVVETEFEERREGGLNAYTLRFPKGSKLSNIILKRGITDSEFLWKWHQDIVAGIFNPRNISIVLMDSTGTQEKWRWNLTTAYPVKWSGPELKADGNTVAIETLELTYHGISKQ